jgi:glycosyltransferase involved in cell wall biosynthesis
MPITVTSATTATQVHWLHSHFLNWTGGHQYIYEVVKRLSKTYGLTVIASAASPQARGKFADIGIDFRTVNVRSTNSAAFWLTLPLQLFSESRHIRSISRANPPRVTITSMFPMNVLADSIGSPQVQLCWEPYALFWDRAYLRDFKLREQLFIRAMRTLYGKMDISATRRSKSILTLSNFNKQWISDIYGRRDAAITYEGVDTQFFRPTRSPVIDCTYKDLKTILHSTDFTATKGTEYLIRALPLVKQVIPNVKVLVTHTLSNEDRKQEMQALAQDLGVLDVVEFLGRVDYLLLPAYYTRADVVAQPSINQSMSLSVKEAMACGTPVVTSPEGDEQTADGDAGFLVDPRDSRRLGEALTRILTDDVLATRMGERGREIIATKFSWDAVAATFQQAIEGAL